MRIIILCTLLVNALEKSDYHASIMRPSRKLCQVIYNLDPVDPIDLDPQFYFALILSLLQGIFLYAEFKGFNKSFKKFSKK